MSLPGRGGQRGAGPRVPRSTGAPSGLGPRPISQASPLLDANAAARLLGVPPRWLLAQARDRRVPHQRLGRYVRFDPDELIRWVEQNRIDPNRLGR